MQLVACRTNAMCLKVLRGQEYQMLLINLRNVKAKVLIILAQSTRDFINKI